MNRLIKSFNVIIVLVVTLLNISPLVGMNEDIRNNEHWELGAGLSQELIEMYAAINISSRQPRSFDLRDRPPLSSYGTILLNVAHTADISPEYYQKQALDAENYNLTRPLFLLPKEILHHIVSCCFLQHKDQSEVLIADMKNALKLRGVCKKFNTILTVEVIGGFCKNYDQIIKNITLNKITGLTGAINYHTNYLPIYILIHAQAEVINNKCVLRIATQNNDFKLVELLFEHHANPNLQSSGQLKNLFYIRSKKIAKLFIKYGADIHISNEKYPNVLWKVAPDQDCSSELLKLYLEHNVDAKKLDLDRKTCLLHHFANQDSSTIKDVTTFLGKATLLLNKLSDMINHQDVYGKTPLDWAYQSLVKAREMKNIYLRGTPEAFEKLIELYKQRGALTGECLNKC